jgi:type VII secretion-associated serine protease mycosin
VGYGRGSRPGLAAPTRTACRPRTGDRDALRTSTKIGATTAAFSLLSVIATPGSPAQADGIRDKQWYLESLKVASAHAISKGTGIIVAVIDTGTYPHPDLQRNLLQGQDVTSGASGDGQNDLVGHGTEMGALIAANGKNPTTGMLGIAPAAKILPVKASNRRDAGSAEDFGSGIEWATRNGAKVINVSFTLSPSFALRDAVRSSLDSDVVIVAGVGNTATNGVIAYPAALEGVLTVGASGRDGEYDPLSVKDPKVDLCAPGVDTLTASPKDKYKVSSGTSPATAIVSGAAALVRSKFPQLSGEEVIHRLTATADDIGPPGRDDECGFGELNIVKALTADVPPLDGSGGVSATPSAGQTSGATTTPARPTATSPNVDASPKSDDAGNRTGVIVGALVAVVAVAALVGFLVVRRRRTP